jgi:starch phosphorylase
MAKLGPAVSAERMLQDYVGQLYQPACRSGRLAVRDGYASARQIASWRSKIKDGWSAVQVEHVDSLGVSEEPQIGDSLTVHAYVALGSLGPDDVSVEVVHGRASENDDLSDVAVAELQVAEDLGRGRFLFSGEIVIDHSGSFGYTVRVLPEHESLASKAELGLVVNA